MGKTPKKDPVQAAKSVLDAVIRKTENQPKKGAKKAISKAKKK